MLDLLSIKQQADEPVIEFLERFRRVKRKCSVQLPENECTSIAVKNMNPQLRQKLIGSEYYSLAQLSWKAARVEQFIIEREREGGSRDDLIEQGLKVPNWWL